MKPSEALEARVRELAQHLERVNPNIMRCHVTIEAPRHHQRQGNLYEVHVDLTVPGREIVAGKMHHDQQSHEDPYVALRDAFRAAERQVEDFAREHRQDVKHHESWPSGWISLLSPVEDFGRIESSDGRSIYFHRNSVVNAEFERLTTGTKVRFLEEAGEHGPQASRVRLVPHGTPRS